MPPWATTVEAAALLPDSVWASPLVVPCHGQPPSPDTYDVYVGRGGPGGLRWGSPCPWGNPFHTDRYAHLAPRLRLIAATVAYLSWLLEPAQTALRLRARRELTGRRLGCWGPQPGPCHGHAWVWFLSQLPSDDDAAAAAAPTPATPADAAG